MKRYEDLVCSKIEKAQRHLEEAVRTSHFSPDLLSSLLVDIQADAIKMESALKANKILRMKHGYDEEYRAMMKEKFTPPGINELDLLDNIKRTNGHAKKYELTLTDDKGTVLYKNKLFGFLFCAVERIEDIDEVGMIDGVVQTLAIGDDTAIWYAFDQLRQKMAAKINNLMLKMASKVSSGELRNRKSRRNIVRLANGQKIK